MKIKLKTWVQAVVALSVVFALSGCDPTLSGNANASNEALTSVAAMKLGPTAGTSLTGKIIPNVDIKIVSKISGKVASVPVAEGDKVKQGDVLVQLEQDDNLQQQKQAESAVVAAQAKLNDTRAGARPREIQGLEGALSQAQAGANQAAASLEQANAAFDLAQSTYNRLRNLFDSSSTVSKEDLDRGTLEFQKAKSARDQAQAGQQSASALVTAAQAKLDLAHIGPTENTLNALQADVDRLNAGLTLANSALANTAITAPADGIIVKKSIQPGEMAQPGVQILSLVNMDQVQVELSVAENQISKLKSGEQVNIKVQNISDRTFPGVITFVSPVSNTNTSTFPVKITADNKEGLMFAGMVADVALKDSNQAKLEVPKSAVIQKNNKSYVVKLDQDTAHYVEVTPEVKNQDWMYVAANESLHANDQIVVSPNERIAEGMKLKAE